MSGQLWIRRCQHNLWPYTQNTIGCSNLHSVKNEISALFLSMQSTHWLFLHIILVTEAFMLDLSRYTLKSKAVTDKIEYAQSQMERS